MNPADLSTWKALGGGGYYPTIRQDYDASGFLVYVGMAERGSATSAAVWRIYRLTYTGSNLTLIQTSLPQQIWDDRATVTFA